MWHVSFFLPAPCCLCCWFGWLFLTASPITARRCGQSPRGLNRECGHGNGKFPLNADFYGKFIYKWWIYSAWICWTCFFLLMGHPLLRESMTFFFLKVPKRIQDKPWDVGRSRQSWMNLDTRQAIRHEKGIEDTGSYGVSVPYWFSEGKPQLVTSPYMMVSTENQRNICTHMLILIFDVGIMAMPPDFHGALHDISNRIFSWLGFDVMVPSGLGYDLMVPKVQHGTPKWFGLQ